MPVTIDDITPERIQWIRNHLGEGDKRVSNIELARRVGCSSADTIRRWIEGERKPLPKFQHRLLQLYVFIHDRKKKKLERSKKLPDRLTISI